MLVLGESLDLDSVLIAALELGRTLGAELTASRRHVKIGKDRNEVINARIVGVRLVDLPILQLEDGEAGLLARGEVVLTFVKQLLLGHVVVLDRLHLLVQSDVVIVVEVAAMAAEPGELVPHGLLEGVNLVNWSAADGNKRGILVGEVSKVREVVGHEAAATAAFIGGGFKHEMVHNELRLLAEEVLQRLDGTVRRMERVILGHRYHGEGSNLGSEVISGACMSLLLLEEGEASSTPFFRGDNL